MMMTRLTTSASTGLLMKMSVKPFMAPASAVGRRRRESGLERARVVDVHRRAVPQLERALADDLLARLDPLDDRDEIAHARAQPHELLTHREHGLAVGTGLS